MKTFGLITLIAVSHLLSAQASARDGHDHDHGPAYRLEAVNWAGTLRCEEKQHEPDHRKDHACGLEFVNDETGQVWNVRDNPTLAALHRQYGSPVKVRVAAMSSPRFLLGGSFIEVKGVEVLKESAE